MSKKKEYRSHAITSASGSERWMNCKLSVIMGIEHKSPDTDYNIEGTAAHKVVEDVMREFYKEKLRD